MAYDMHSLRPFFMQPQHNYVVRAVLALALTALVAGCNSTTTKTAESTEPKKAVAQEEYVRTTSTGSWIPKKVKKKDTPKGDAAVQEVNPESMEKLNEAGRTMGTRGVGGAR